jgi:hypothetical protein
MDSSSEMPTSISEKKANDLVGTLVQLMDGLLGGQGEASVPTDALSVPAALQNSVTELSGLIATLMDSSSEMATSISEKASDLVGTLVQLMDGLLGGQGEAPILTDALSVPAALNALPSQAPSPVPSQAPSPVPFQAPSPVPSQAPPVSTSLSAAGAMQSGVDSVLFAGILASFSILLIGGRVSWPSYELFKPTSALRLAIERPG